ncbi:MAG: AraC family transcriptional regulator [Arachnia sp.]
MDDMVLSPVVDGAEDGGRWLPGVSTIAAESCPILSHPAPRIGWRLTRRICDCHLMLMQDTIEELRRLALKHANGAHGDTAIPRVAISRGGAEREAMPGVYEPMMCLILQGTKCILIGDQALHYDHASYFISTIDVPAMGDVQCGGVDQPHLALTLRFDPQVISDVLISMEDDAPGIPTQPSCGFGISPMTPRLARRMARLLRLIETPAAIPVLAPLIEREIIYRLLTGPRGCTLRQIATGGSRLTQVRRAISWIRDNLTEPFQIEDLAARSGMSASAFHRHFKTLTAMSPVQYQKQLRLHVARRKLIAEAGDVAHVAFSVGYESATQFSREYARMFGASPAKDGARLRRLDAESVRSGERSRLSAMPLIRLPAPSPRNNGEKAACGTVGASSVPSPRSYGERVRVRGSFICNELKSKCGKKPEIAGNDGFNKPSITDGDNRLKHRTTVLQDVMAPESSYAPPL